MSERATPQPDVSLAPFSTLGVGGPARWLFRAEHVDDVRAAHVWAGERGIPLLILGGGSNMVLSDEGYDGLVVQMALMGTEVTRSNGCTIIRAAAGAEWDGVAETAVDRGLAGVECLSGIPGSVGATPIQNVGAYGQEVGDVIDSVTVFDTRSGDVLALSAKDCRFEYRMSRFKREDAGRFVICDVAIRLSPGPPTVVYPDVVAYLQHTGIALPTVGDVRRAVLAIRRRKGMVLDSTDPDTRSVGSFFMNPVVIESTLEGMASIAGMPVPAFPLSAGRVKVPAAWLIERAGFRKGEVDGGAAISAKHPLAIVNRGGATARDVVRLAARMKRQVMGRFGVSLSPEPVFVGFTSDPDVEYLLDHLR